MALRPTLSALWTCLYLLCLGSTVQAAFYNGLIYEVVGSEVHIIGDHPSLTGVVQIPAQLEGLPVTTIGDSTFANNNNVTKIQIPDSVNTIGASPFIGCRNLTSITVDPANPSFSSAAGILYNVTGTHLLACPPGIAGPISIPNTTITIEEPAFSYCSELTSITVPPSVQVIGDFAFSLCSKLTTATIEPGVISIGQHAFGTCRALTNVSLPTTITAIAAGTFQDCDALTSIALPSSITSIGDFAFYRCDELAQITIPANTALIGQEAFFRCDKLTAVELLSPSITIGLSAFESCPLLTSVTTANSGPGPFAPCSIGDLAFRNCLELTTLTLPGGTTTIGSQSFDGCLKLQNLVIPSQVTQLEWGAFRYCSAMKSLSLQSLNPTIGPYCFANCTALSEVISPLAPGSTATGGALQESAFGDCHALVTIEFPVGTTSVGDDAFNNCYALEDIRFPAGLTSIGEGSFINCNSLNHVTIPSGVHQIGYFAFGLCNNLRSAAFLGDAPAILGNNPFPVNAPAFSVYFFDSATGFTSPTWEGYPAASMGVADPTTPWLLEHEFPIGTPMNSDPNSDGVSLLLAYALALDPNLHLSKSLFPPTSDGTGLCLSHFASAPGVTYHVETSTNLIDWTTNGVTLSSIDSEGYRKASISPATGCGFMRLNVELSD